MFRCIYYFYDGDRWCYSPGGPCHDANTVGQPKEVLEVPPEIERHVSVWGGARREEAE